MGDFIVPEAALLLYAAAQLDKGRREREAALAADPPPRPGVVRCEACRAWIPVTVAICPECKFDQLPF